jgi:translation initiation factor IF-3
VVKEIKMRPKIETHDYDFKKRHIEEFLVEGDKVKVTLMFRGREMAHLDLGRKLLDQLATDLASVGKVEAPARQEGRNMVLLLTPVSTKGRSQKRPASEADVSDYEAPEPA